MDEVCPFTFHDYGLKLFVLHFNFSSTKYTRLSRNKYLMYHAYSLSLTFSVYDTNHNIPYIILYIFYIALLHRRYGL